MVIFHSYVSLPEGRLSPLIFWIYWDELTCRFDWGEPLDQIIYGCAMHIAGFARARQQFSSIDPLNISPRETSITSDDLLINLSELRVFWTLLLEPTSNVCLKRNRETSPYLPIWNQWWPQVSWHPIIMVTRVFLVLVASLSLWPGGPRPPGPAEHCCRHGKCQSVSGSSWLRMTASFRAVTDRVFQPHLIRSRQKNSFPPTWTLENSPSLQIVLLVLINKISLTCKCKGDRTASPLKMVYPPQRRDA